MKKKKADPKASPKNTQPNNTSAEAQRARLLERLQEGPVSTIEARRDLNILMPAARVKELRTAGHVIQTHRMRLHDDQGRPHSGVALYLLSSVPANSEASA
ncbi:helix-turn-helix domain-containing protein [Pseudomonas sp. LRF_L74]|uniref:helix-turn-helix domain-containing protein n=1 Tax=Pseudomonas sp. LRF_L74 TaxID=3369422 RepID=UPI003F604861